MENDHFPDLGHLTATQRLVVAAQMENVLRESPETPPALAARIQGYVMGIRHGVAPEPR